VKTGGAELGLSVAGQEISEDSLVCLDVLDWPHDIEGLLVWVVGGVVWRVHEGQNLDIGLITVADC